MTEDMEALLNYVLDNELESFHEYISECGSEALTNGETLFVERHSLYDNYGNGDGVYELLQKAAMNQKQKHIWAIAHRIRKELENGSSDS